MTPEKEAELLAKLDLMLELHRRTEVDIREIRADMRDMRSESRDSRGDVAGVGDRLSRIEGRIEEQSKMLQLALAGRQPKRPAA